MPNKVELPSEKELEALPRWARVAFAVRCARRVQPLFTHFWPDAPAEHVEALDKVITLAQASAAHPACASENNLRPADAAEDAAEDAAHAADTAHAAFAYAAAHVAYAAHAAYTAYAYAASAHAAAGHAADAADAAHAAFSIVIRCDFETLRALADAEKWTDDTPVNVTRLGPLWPDGTPQGWPDLPDELPPEFKMAIDPGDANMETIKEVLSALSDLHEAHTGYAITYSVDGALVLAREEVCS